VSPTTPPSTSGVRAAQQAALTSYERVGAVDDEVGALEHRRREARLVGLDEHARVDEAELDRRAVRLGRADVGGVVERLAVQVGDLDVVGVDDPDPPHPRADQVGGHRRAERPRADDEHTCLAQRELRGLRPVRQDELPRIAVDLGRRQACPLRRRAAFGA
jgi:hypothetical protein